MKTIKKSHNLLRSYWGLQRVGLCKGAELVQGGSVTNGATPFNYFFGHYTLDPNCLTIFGKLESLAPPSLN